MGREGPLLPARLGQPAVRAGAVRRRRTRPASEPSRARRRAGPMRPLGVIARALKRADHQLGRLRGRRQVLVDIRTPMNLVVLRPVWSRLLADSRVELSFTAEQTATVREALA